MDNLMGIGRRAENQDTCTDLPISFAGMLYRCNMGSYQDLTGSKFNKLHVVCFSHKDKGGRSYFKCICDCGNEKIVRGNHIKNGSVKSCGCHRRETNLTHGCASGARTKEYIAWQNMVARCHRKKHPEYYRYGARGIIVCNDWKTNFELFLSEVGVAPDKNSVLDRIDNSIGYFAGNVRWISPTGSSCNRRYGKRRDLPKGVYRHKYGKYWSRVVYKGKDYHCGTHDTIEGAMLAYNKKAKIVHGDFFEESVKEELKK